MAEIITSDLQELCTFWRKAVTPFVTLIVQAAKTDRERALPVASGIFVRSQKKRYLLTAHHVTRQNLADDPAERVGALYYAELSEFSELGGSCQYLEDPYDLNMTEISIGGRFLRLPVDLALDVRDGERCLMYGFPARSKSWKIERWGRGEFALGSRPFSCIGTIYKASPLSFTIRVSLKQISFQRKKLQRIGKLNGISGGGVFVIRNDAPKLAGVMIECIRNRAELVCTNSRLVLEMARKIGSL